MGLTSGTKQSLWHACALAHPSAAAYLCSAHRPLGALFTQFCCTRYSGVRSSHRLRPQYPGDLLIQFCCTGPHLFSGAAYTDLHLYTHSLCFRAPPWPSTDVQHE